MSVASGCWIFLQQKLIFYTDKIKEDIKLIRIDLVHSRKPFELKGIEVNLLLLAACVQFKHGTASNLEHFIVNDTIFPVTTMAKNGKTLHLFLERLVI